LANIINGTDTGSGGLITTGDSSDELQLQTAEVARVTLTNTAVVVNESGADVDFRVEGDTDANLLFVDASTDRVGIGTSSPARALTVFSSSSGNNVRLYNVGFTSLEIVSDRVTPTQNIGGISFLDSTTATASQIVGQVDGVLAFVNGGLERMRLTSDGYLRLAGGGIQFNGDTLAANALDDYEEGTWTPVYIGTSGSIGSTAYTTRNGTYTKIGNVVIVGLQLLLSNKGSWTGTVKITGLPFTAANDGVQSIGGLQVNNVTFADQINLRVGPNEAEILPRLNTSGAGGSFLQTTAVVNNSEFYGIGIYRV
jgi:hypothetical protein